MSKSNISVGNQKWADRFNEAWDSSNEKILEACRILVQAQKELPKADFTDLIKNKIRCSESVARKLIIVGKDERLCALVHKLPVHWTIHYELTKLTDDELDRAFDRGFNQDSRRDDVKKLRAPTVTNAEYQDITQSPGAGEGPGAVSATPGSEIPPLAPALGTAPHDDREGGDSDVTLYTLSESEGGDSHVIVGEASAEDWQAEIEMMADAGLQGHYHDDPEAVAHETLAESSVTTDRAEGEAPQAVAPPFRADESIFGPPRDGMIALWIDPAHPMSVFATGLMMAMDAITRLTVAGAAAAWPENMPLLTADLHDFADRLIDFEAAYRAQHGNGNAAALGADAAQ